MPTPAQRLKARLADGGSIPFAEFMAEALYGENGYYTRGPAPMDAGGDFVTGSSLSPIFGRATAALVRRLDEALGRPADILEVGYGHGRHLETMVECLGNSSQRRILACDRVPRPLPAGVQGLANLDKQPPRSLTGLVFSYELFDALPIHRLIGRLDGTVGELWVELSPEEDFRYVEGAISDASLIGGLGGGEPDLEPGQVADVTPEWGSLYRQLAEILDIGLVVTCDYGFERRGLFDRRVRFHGTLACYRRHRVHRDALRAVGEQDLTAHVDFTTLREAGEAAGLATVSLSRQARWLLACGVFDQLQDADQTTRLEALDLLNADGMGEEIRVLVQGRGVSPSSLFDLDVLGS